MASAEWDKPFKPMKLTCVLDAAKLTDRGSSEWQLGIDRIADMRELLEERGIRIFLIELPDDVSGLTCLDWRSVNRPSVPVIVVTSSHNIKRRRMTLARELAHRFIIPESTVDTEKLAMRFAGAFLTSSTHLASEVGRCRHSLG